MVNQSNGSSQYPIERLVVYKLWDKQIPIIFTSFECNEPLIPLKTVCHMFNLDYDFEYDRVVNKSLYLTQICWQYDLGAQIEELDGLEEQENCIMVSALPLFLAGSKRPSEDDADAGDTYDLIQFLIHKVFEKKFHLGDGNMRMRFFNFQTDYREFRK